VCGVGRRLCLARAQLRAQQRGGGPGCETRALEVRATKRNEQLWGQTVACRRGQVRRRGKQRASVGEAVCGEAAKFGERTKRSRFEQGRAQGPKFANGCHRSARGCKLRRPTAGCDHWGLYSVCCTLAGCSGQRQTNTEQKSRAPAEAEVRLKQRFTGGSPEARAQTEAQVEADSK